ncbi:type II secretion system protein N [Acinetobacter sp. YH16032]|uniref:type II secretion system protein N n=1 Tax=Acinetobacter sp. YH16032 TaxID=2601181 RepID=UPI0015D0E20D|nr:type II secretion system protein N [Acinetobacter sp. YH16032]
MIKKSKKMVWLSVAIFAFLLFVFLQVPASWLIAKFYKNNQILKNVSGNIWQGQADWQKGNLAGSVIWQTRPFDLILLRAGANLEIHSGQTQLNGVVGYGLGKKIIIKNMSGNIAPETLKTFVDWQWPQNSIQLKDVAFQFKQNDGFAKTDGEMQWGGGTLTYTFAQKQERMNMPSLKGQFSDEAGKLLIDVQDQRGQKMANLSLDPALMLDAQVTQRLLMNVPSYDGKAGLDTFVVSTRQPLLSGGF